MPVHRVKATGRWQAVVQDARALPGYTRIRRNFETRAEAVEAEAEIALAIQNYGKWPVGPEDRPVVRGRDGRRLGGTKAGDRGTIRQAADIALESRWAGSRYAASVSSYVRQIVDWFEARGTFDLDEVVSRDIEEMVAAARRRGNSASTVNAKLSALSVIWDVAMERTPRLASRKVKIRRVAAEPVEKWWLRPEDEARLLAYYRANGDAVFAAYVEFVCETGLRVEEALRVRPSDVSGLGSERGATLLVRGRKTADAEGAIPLSPRAAEIVESLRDPRRPNAPLFGGLDYEGARRRWDEGRALLGVSEVPTSTLKALRRSFAARATARGMPTAILQRVLRHKTIGTTVGYVNLVGGEQVEAARGYLGAADGGERDAEADHASSVLAALVRSGATPETIAEVAQALASRGRAVPPAGFEPARPRRAEAF